MFNQCWAQGQEFKKVLVLGDVKADEWNIFLCIYIFIYIFIYIYIHTCICIYSALKINSPASPIEITHLVEGKKECDSTTWMNVKNTCNFFYMNWADPEVKCKELPLGNHLELN